jgi:hypothetical protein
MPCRAAASSIGFTEEKSNRTAFDSTKCHRTVSLTDEIPTLARFA